jgi:hypothetical protein
LEILKDMRPTPIDLKKLLDAALLISQQA